MSPNAPEPSARSEADAPRLFRRLAAAVEATGEATDFGPTASALQARLVERLQRDLLPRTAGSHEHLVVGIVGPNNAGKSLLFNSLVGRPLSPSEPQGGATRRLVGAAHPELFAALAAEPSLAQFPLTCLHETPDGPLDAARLNAEDPAELLLAPIDGFGGGGLLLIDAPDFDSILAANRAASESLLKVVDLALVVVTRHTYHNELVVRFLEGWLRHGRPWALVYNEAYEDESITRGHAEQLAEKLGSEPVAVFHAPFDIELQRGTAGAHLAPTMLGEASIDLSTWLTGAEGRRLKRRALSASTAQLAGDLSALREELEREAALAAAILDTARGPARLVAASVASRAMPPGPFLEAFRAVADRRIAPWRRAMRSGTRKLRRSIEGLASLATGTSPATKNRKERAHRELSVAALEARHLAPELGPYLEELTAALGADAPFWRRPPALGPGDGSEAGVATLQASVSADLARAASIGAPTAADLADAGDERLLASFEEVCEQLIEAELDGNRKGGEALVQFGVDLLHAAPIAAGIGTAIATGGLGMDVASVAAGGLGVAMADRFTKFLGAGVAREARRSWRDLRGQVLSASLVRLALASTAGPLATASATRGERAAELAGLETELAGLTLPAAASSRDHESAEKSDTP